MCLHSSHVVWQWQLFQQWIQAHEICLKTKWRTEENLLNFSTSKEGNISRICVCWHRIIHASISWEFPNSTASSSHSLSVIGHFHHFYSLHSSAISQAWNAYPIIRQGVPECTPRASNCNTDTNSSMFRVLEFLEHSLYITEIWKLLLSNEYEHKCWISSTYS